MSREGLLLRDFLAEAEDRLASFERGVADLERTAAAPDPEAVDALFRDIHSIKGSAAFLGLVSVTTLSHAMETALGRIRDGRLAPNRTVVETLLQGSDLLSEMVGDIAGSALVDASAVEARLLGLTGEPPLQAGAGQEASASAPQNADPELVGRMPAEHDHLYRIVCDLHELEEAGGSPRGLLGELASTGLILDSRLDIPAVGFGLEVLEAPVRMELAFSTMLDPEMMGLVTGLPPEAVTDLALPRRPEEAGAPPPDRAQAPRQPVPHPQVQAETVRLPVELLDSLMALTGELVLVRNQQILALEGASGVDRSMVQRLHAITSQLQEQVARTRLQPMEVLFAKIPRIVRDLSPKLGKEIEVTIQGGETEVDKGILERLADPLTHLVRNACDHGIETPEDRLAAGKPRVGRISLHARQESGRLHLIMEDDGRGVDLEAVKRRGLEAGLLTREELAAATEQELLRLILRPGFSTAGKVTEVSGRGVGLDVVMDGLEKLGGSLEASSRAGQGARFHLRMPLTLAVIPCLLVRSGGHRFALPRANVREVGCFYDDEAAERVSTQDGREVCRLRRRALPLVRLGEILARPRPLDAEALAAAAARQEELREERRARQHEMRRTDPEAVLPQTLHFAAVQAGRRRFALAVDEILGVAEIVVKPMHPALKSLPLYGGATILGDGTPALILDMEGLAVHAAIPEGDGPAAEDRAEQADGDCSILIIANDEDDPLAVPLSLVRRVVRVLPSEVLPADGREYLRLGNESVLVLRLENLLPTARPRTSGGRFLLLPKFMGSPVGILFSRLLDVERDDGAGLDPSAEDGVLGSRLLKGRRTRFPDLFRLVERAEPGWFAPGPGRSPAGIGKGKVLVVEDSPFFRKMVSGFLEAQGLSAAEAGDGRQALDLLGEGGFDLIVSDLRMPVMDGLAFIREVRRRPGSRDIPALALTSLDAEADRTEALAAGFDRFEVKLDRERLLDAAADLLARGAS